MATLVVCPQCGASVAWPAEGRPRCPKCDAWWSYAVRRPGAPPRPPLLTLMAFFVSLLALVFILLFLVAALGGGPYFVNGEPATRGEFPIFLLPLAPPVPLAALAAHGSGGTGAGRGRRWWSSGAASSWGASPPTRSTAPARTSRSRCRRPCSREPASGEYLYLKRYYDAL